MLFTSYNASTVLQCHFRNIIVGPGDTLFQVLQWQNMCFIIKNDKGFEVNSQAGKSVNIILCKTCFVNPVFSYPVSPQVEPFSTGVIDRQIFC